MNLLMVCGAGDFVAIESFLPQEFKDNVETLFWATRAKTTIQQLLPINKVFANVRQEITLHDSWCTSDEWKGEFTDEKRPYCITGKDELRYLDIDLDQYDTALDSVVDCSALNIIKNISRNNWSYQGSAYVQNTLANVSHFSLPKQYVTIHPFSANALSEYRDISKTDWGSIINFLQRINLEGVIVGTGEGSVDMPSGNTLINLIDKTTPSEAAEITKQGTYFIGCASLFSVIASKTLPQDNIFIKGHPSLHSAKYQTTPTDSITLTLPQWSFYYAPLKDNTKFLSQDFDVLNRKRCYTS